MNKLLVSPSPHLHTTTSTKSLMRDVVIALLPAEEAQRALEIVRSCPYGENVTIIGRVDAGEGVILRTALGGRRRVGPLGGEGLPRIC